MTPPTRLRIATVADRGRPPGRKSGQLEYLLTAAGSLRSLGVAPGCWMLTNSVVPSGVKVAPVSSQFGGPVRKRRVSPLAGSQASIWLLPMFLISPLYIAAAATSVDIHNTPRASNRMPSGQA